MSSARDCEKTSQDPRARCETLPAILGTSIPQTVGQQTSSTPLIAAESSMGSDDEYSDDARQHDQNLMAACESGQLDHLRSLVEAGGVSATTKTIMMRQAIEDGRAEILSYLLDIDPSLNLRLVMLGTLSRPDASMLKQLYEADPDIVNYEFGDGTTALQKSIDQSDGNDAIPMFLLDHGADPRERGKGGFRPLDLAVVCHQPVSLAIKLIDKGVEVRADDISWAVQHRRLDIAKYFLRECRVVDEENIARHLREKAQELGDAELSAELERRIKTPVSASNDGDGQNGGSRRWWQLGKSA